MFTYKAPKCLHVNCTQTLGHSADMEEMGLCNSRKGVGKTGSGRHNVSNAGTIPRLDKPAAKMHWTTTVECEARYIAVTIQKMAVCQPSTICMPQVNGLCVGQIAGS
jgi:hypothetical protein